MSLVARQSFKYSLIGYFGFLLGSLTSIFIFPKDLEYYGKLRFILPTAEMILPIVVFGLSFSNVKFFLKAQNENKTQNLLFLSLLGIVFNFCVFLLLFFLVFYFFPSLKESNLWKMKRLILPLVLVMALSQVFNKYISNFKRIVVPNIFETIFPKIANLGAFCLFFYLGFSEKWSYSFFLAVFVAAFIGYIWYANRLEHLQPNFDTQFLRKNAFWKEILCYSFFGFLGNLGNYIAFRIDNFMIGEFIGFEENGAYSFILSILSFVMIPQMGINNISAPIINKCLAEENYQELNLFHKKTSLNLFFIGAVLFSCIIVGYPFLTHFIHNGKQLLAAEPIVWILGASMLFDLATGFNGYIISLSKYFRFNIVVMLILAITTIGLNLFFIYYTHLGILGIAIATAISLSFFNLIKIIYNYQKFSVFPIGRKILLTALICGVSVVFVCYLPEQPSMLFNLVYKPSVLLICVFGANYFLKLFPIEAYINRDFIKNLFKF